MRRWKLMPGRTARQGPYGPQTGNGHMVRLMVDYSVGPIDEWESYALSMSED
jgi:hypothetical protein